MCNTCGCKSAETFEAYDDSISERQEWLIGELGGKVDKSMNRSKASDYIKKLKGKESGTWKDAESFEANEWFEENRPLFKESKRRIKTSPYDYNPVCSTCGGRMFAIGPYEMRDRSRIGNKQNDFFVMGCRNDGCSNYGYGAEGESKRKGSYAPKMQLITYEDVLREKMKNQNMKDAETFEAEKSYHEKNPNYGTRRYRNYDCEKGRHRWRDSMNGRRYYPTQDEDGFNIIIEENHQGCQDCGIYKTYRNTYTFKEASFEEPKTYHMTYGSKKGKLVPIYDEKMERFLEESNAPTYGQTYLYDTMRGYGAEGESKRKGSHTPKMQLITYEDVLREKMKNQNMKDAETFDSEGDDSLSLRYNHVLRELANIANEVHQITTPKRKATDYLVVAHDNVRKSFNQMSKDGYNMQMYGAETFEANEEAVEQTDANMVNEGSVEAFYGGGAKVSVSSAGIQPTANPSVDEAFNVGNQVGLDVAEQEIMNENPSVEVNYGGEDMSLKESAKLGFGVGAGLLGFNVALLGIATIGGFLLNRD